MCLGASRCAWNRITPDVEASAIQSGDETALVEGCGQQLSSGLTLCRKQEGDVASDAIYFVGPPTKCVGDGPCVSFKIYFPDSTPAYGDSISQGQTRSKPIPWSMITGKQTFAMGDRGLWPFSYEVKLIDKKGQEQKSYSDGEIVLRVYKKGYIPLANIEGDPNFVWDWIENGVHVKMTTGLRVWLSPRQF